MTVNTAETITFYLEKILQSVHPLMAEGLYLAAVPHWYSQALFTAMRQRDDGRNEGLVERLTRYSFVARLDDGDDPTYTVRPEERAYLLRHWITKDPDAFIAAHRRALAYWDENPDENEFAQAQNRLYHLLFVDTRAAGNYLVQQFRIYHNDRQLTAIERLLDTVEQARFYLSQLNRQELAELDDLVTHLRARLAQLRGKWQDSLNQLEPLQQKTGLSPTLQPYVTRAYGYALAQTGKYVEAIAVYRSALAQFEQSETAVTDTAVSAEDTRQSERALTMLALGDAHVDLAISVHSRDEEDAQQLGHLHYAQTIFLFLLSIPLLLYLSRTLGRRVWHPRFWPTLRGLDWIVARLFATGARYYKVADDLLEQYGAPAEAVAADEKLAYLYLAMGDAQQAQTLFLRLLAEEEAPLGEYRQAAVRVGLGRALLQLEQVTLAQEQFADALPVLRRFEDTDLLATAQATMAETSFLTAAKENAIRQFDQAITAFHAQNDVIRATNTAERMEALIREQGVPDDLREEATAVSQSVSERQYNTRYRHPAIIHFRRAIVLLLPLLLLLIPLTTINLDTGSGLKPNITFRAAPLLDPSEVVTSSLSQGVATANVVRTTDAQAILWLGVALFAGYFLLSSLLGLALIALTPLQTVQARSRATRVRVDDEGIAVGSDEDARSLSWTAVSKMVSGNIALWQMPWRDNSALALAGDGTRLLIRGNTHWYTALQARITRTLPDTTRITNVDTHILRSRAGIIYLGNLLLLGVLFLLARFYPAPLWRDFPGLPYSVVDLYPYLYLGLVLAPLWWGVIRPLRTQKHLNPASRLPWYYFGLGVILALLQALTLFRPLLTDVNLYPPLITLILIAAGGWAIWQTRNETAPLTSPRWRWATAVLGVLVLLLMAFILWREATAYHFLVFGNTRRDRALQIEDPDAQTAMLEAALGNYNRAVRIGATPILGVDVRTSARVPVGIPEPHNFTWLAALTSRAALQVQLGLHPEAIGTFTVVLEYTDQVDEIYAWRAIARQSWQPGATAQQEDELLADENQYEKAKEDFGRAIALNPRRMDYLLWRGVTQHALGELATAYADYTTALKPPEEIDDPILLTPESAAKALIGQGWILYADEEYTQAQQKFEEAAQTDPQSAAAWLGQAYAYWSLGQYEAVLPVLEQAETLDPDDPSIQITLGTLYWKLGGRAETIENRCRLYTQSVDYFTRAAEISDQDRENVAFTYRTRGQVQSLLNGCPDYEDPHPYTLTIASYDRALELDPDNADYYQKRGRFAYALWLQLPDTPERDDILYDAWRDINEAYDRGLRDDVTRRFRRAILNALRPLALDRAAAFMDAGAFDQALDEYVLLAENLPEDAALAFRAGLAALGAGDQAATNRWFAAGIAAAADTNETVSLLTQALDWLDDFLAENPAVDGTAVRTQLTAALEAARENDPTTAFRDGLDALNDNNLTAATELYRRGLTLAVQRRDFESVGTAVIALHALPEADAAPILTLFRRELSRLELAAGDETDTEAAYKLGLIAIGLDRPAQAAFWYNEGIRRAAINNQYPVLRASRGDLYDLWSVSEVVVTELLAEMADALPEFWTAHPDMQEDPLYWRFRAWFFYGLGLSAFRLDAETAAETALDAGQETAALAYDLDPGGNAYVESYLAEAAWGWYHVARGDDAYNDGDYAAALDDYTTAAEVITPDDNGDAFGDAITAAFRAGLAAVRLEDEETAAEWYTRGLQWAEQYDRLTFVPASRDELLALLEAKPDLAYVIEPILALFPQE